LGFIFLPFAVIRRKHLRLPARIVSVLLLLFGSVTLIAGIGACGGSSSSSSSPGQQAQSYTLTVTATSGAQSSSTTLTLTVQ
jgi:hypothetical protein